MTDALPRPDLAGWDLPYRIARRVFGSIESLDVLLPAAFVFAFGLVDAFVLVPAAGGELIDGKNAVGLPVSLLIGPVAVALYFFIPGAIAGVLRQLQERGAEQRQHLDRELAAWQRRLSHPLLAAAALLTAALLLSVSVLLLPGGIPQYSLPETDERAVLSFAVWGFVYYAGTMSVLRGFGMTYLMLRLRRAEGVEFTVDPHHVDGAGGWATLGNYLLGHLLGVASATVGVSIVLYTTTVKEAWQQIVLAGSMPIAAIALVGLPLWLAHTMMRPARRAAIAEIRARRRREDEAMRAAVTDGNDEVSISSRLDVLKSLDEAEQYVRRRYPVVPFHRPVLLTLNSVTTISVILGTSSTAFALFRTVTS